MIKGAIFDIDGVILNSMGIWKDLGARYLKMNAIQPEDGLGEILFSMSMEQGAAYLKKHYNLAESEEKILTDIQKMIETFYFYEVESKEGVKELLEFLQNKKIPMVAATSSPREHVSKALIRNGMMDFFEEIYTTSEVGESKHSPKIYDLSAEFLHTRPEETMVFEDSLYALTTAKEAGYRGMGVFDAEGEQNQDQMKEIAEIYIVSYREFLQNPKLEQLFEHR